MHLFPDGVAIEHPKETRGPHACYDVTVKGGPPLHTNNPLERGPKEPQGAPRGPKEPHGALKVPKEPLWDPQGTPMGPPTSPQGAPKGAPPQYRGREKEASHKSYIRALSQTDSGSPRARAT